MSDFEKLSKDIIEKVYIAGTIGEDVGIIDQTLAPIKALKRLSANPSTLDATTFVGQSSEELTRYLLSCIDALSMIKKTMKTRRNQLEELEPLYVPYVSDSIPQLVSDVSDLKSTLGDFVSSQPKPTDYAAAVVSQLPQSTLSKPVNNVNIRKEVKQASEEQIRSNNLIIYQVAYNKMNPMRASDCAKEYFGSCGVALFHLERDKIVDAQYLSVSPDQTTCNIKVMMTNPMVVRSLLSVTRQLKTTESDTFCDKQFDFTRTFVSKDRTKSEQEQHRKLILDLKLKISEDPSIRWVIKFGRIQSGGRFQ